MAPIDLNDRLERIKCNECTSLNTDRSHSQILPATKIFATPKRDCHMPPTRILASLTPLSRVPVRHAQSRLGLPLAAYQRTQSRNVAQDHSDLGGPAGSEPPGPLP